MTDSPEKGSEGVLKLAIYSGGARLPDNIQFDSVTVEKAVNMISIARVVIPDGDMPNQEFPISDSDVLKPGSEIKINAGYGDSEETIFEGIVIKHSVKISGDNYARLSIECRDKAVGMTVGRKNANYIQQKDSDIFAKLIGNCSGVRATTGPTTTEHKELVQYYCTDWDFMLSRAEVNGMVVLVDDAEVTVDTPEVSGSAVLDVAYGKDLYEFHADLDARNQFSQVKGACWDPKFQQVVEVTAGTETLNEQGNINSSALAEVLGLSSFDLRTPVAMEETALKDWASAQQIKSGLARITGRMKFQGSAKAKPGKLIEVSGVGARFNGNVFVSSVVHEILEGDWSTEVNFGMSANWFADRRDLATPTASGLIPGIEGLHIGVVMKLDDDPEGQNRIQVKLPVSQAETEGVWARLSTYYASSEFGEFFIPEIGDEVVLGYLNNDPVHPVILGSLYSAKNTPPYDLTSDNFIKAIVTKSKLKVEFDDEKKVITILTPGNNTIVISDENQSILIQDQSNNKVELSSNGISLDSPKDISMTSSGKISLEATGEISISSQADVKLSGLNIEHSADVGLTAKGGASAELSAGGNTTVKGAMVMIN